jgi:hypothetical protein
MFDFEPELDTLDSVPDEFRTLYSDDGEGKFILAPKLAEKLGNGAGAAKALRTERAAKTAAERALAAFRAMGETPEAISTQIAELEAEANKASGAEDRVARVKTDLEKTFGTQISSLQTELDNERKRGDADFVARVHADIIAQADGIPHALGPILRERSKIKRNDDGTRSVVFIDENGEEVTNGAGDPIQPKAYAEKLKADEAYGFAFKPSGAKGGGSAPNPHRGVGGKNPFHKDSQNLTEANELIKTNPERARALAAQAGFPVNW